MLRFSYVITLIVIYVMKIHTSDHYGMSIY